MKLISDSSVVEVKFESGEVLEVAYFGRSFSIKFKIKVTALGIYAGSFFINVLIICCRHIDNVEKT